MDKWVCEACRRISLDGEYLTAPNPFDPTDTLTGCPSCKAVNSLVGACDEPGCEKESSMGTPTTEGYRRTCYDHRPKEIAK